MPFFGKSKPKKEKVKKGAPIQVGNLPPSAPGFHKCYFLGAIPAEPTREGSEQAFAKIVRALQSEQPRCIVRATVHGVAAKHYPDRTQLFDVSIMDIRVLTVVGRAVIVLSKDPGGPDAPHTAYSFLTSDEGTAKMVASQLAQVCKTVNAVLNEIANKGGKGGPGADVGSGSGSAPASASPPPATPPAPASQEEQVISLSPASSKLYETASPTAITAPQTYDQASPQEATIDLSPAATRTYDTAANPEAVNSTVSQPRVYDAASASQMEEDNVPAPAYPSSGGGEFAEEPDNEGYLNMIESEKPTHFEPTPSDYITLRSQRSAGDLGKPPDAPPRGLQAIIETVPLYVEPGMLTSEPRGKDFAAMEAGVMPPSKEFIRQMTGKIRRTRDGSITFAS